MTGMTASESPHLYVSTACLHDDCGGCRNSCKYCDAPCSHPCHPAAGQSLPEPWVDQARGIARELLRYGLSTSEAVPPELLHRIDSDPALFWLRGETAPPGEWRASARGKPPAVTLLKEALHLCVNGEYAPGGNENWHDWSLKAERFLRSLLPEPDASP